MDVPTLSLFLRPILTVSFSETGETSDINDANQANEKLYYLGGKHKSKGHKPPKKLTATPLYPKTLFEIQGTSVPVEPLEMPMCRRFTGHPKS